MLNLSEGGSNHIVESRAEKDIVKCYIRSMRVHTAIARHKLDMLDIARLAVIRARMSDNKRLECLDELRRLVDRV